MTTARAAAPNLGGRANTRSRAVVATSQSPTFTAAIRSDGAACLLGDFYPNATAVSGNINRDRRRSLGRGCGGANFNAAARSRHVPGSYNGARAFSRAVGAAATLYQPMRHRAPAGPLPARAGLFYFGFGQLVRWILFLCARHLRDSSDRQAAAIEQLHVLMRQLAPVMEAAGLTQAPAGRRSR